MVALSDAWQKGAQQWSAATREAFANDPLNLIAVDGPTNEGKGDGDTATWLPPNKAIRCTYVAHQVAVKAAYGLWVTQAEQDAMVRVLSGCPDMALPSGGLGQPTSGGTAAEAPAAPAPAAPAPAPAPPATTNANGADSAAPPGADPACPVQGTKSSKIYHLPGDRYYGKLNDPACFASVAEATAAGYRAPRN